MIRSWLQMLTSILAKLSKVEISWDFGHVYILIPWTTFSGGTHLKGCQPFIKINSDIPSHHQEFDVAYLLPQSAFELAFTSLPMKYISIYPKDTSCALSFSF